ncbi:hypothetical protein FRB90_008757 [Tulasnella sp. 427]|nr:hypothetical protein FRB90_008757 [Tulasnella sp. 427]
MGSGRPTKKHASSHKPAKKTSSHLHNCPFAECSQSFARPTDLKRHVKAVHLKVKEFACTICGRAFAQKGGMTTHMNTHTKARPFECRVGCGRDFSDPSSRSRHEFEAHAPPSFKCPECSELFKRKETLKAHIGENHPGSVYPESALGNQMSRELFNAEYLAQAREQYAGPSTSQKEPASKSKEVVHRRRKLVPMEEEDEDDEAHDTDDEDAGSWSARSSDMSMDDYEEAKEKRSKPARRSTRLAAMPSFSMKDASPDWSRAPTPLPGSVPMELFPSAGSSRLSTPLLGSPASSLHPSRVPTPGIFSTPMPSSMAAQLTPTISSNNASPYLAVPPPHRRYVANTPSPLGSRAQTPSRTADPGPSFHRPSALGRPGARALQTPAAQSSLPVPSFGNFPGLALTNPGLDTSLSDLFYSGTMATPLNGLGLDINGAGPSGSPFDNFPVSSGAINPQALYTSPNFGSNSSPSYLPEYMHPTNMESPFSQFTSPAPTAFNLSPDTPAARWPGGLPGDLLDDDWRAWSNMMNSPANDPELIGAGRVDDTLDPNAFNYE